MSEFQALLDEIERLEEENERLTHFLPAHEPDADYWQSVYDRILDAWHKFALAELGTTQPSPVDLQNRPELAALYEAIK
jgi:hypothetical protein